MVRSFCYFSVMILLSALLIGLLGYGDQVVSAPSGSRQQREALVRALGLTDLALCSEARYTRNPTQADLFSAFQDYPGAFEHFPTGAIILPDPVGFTSRVLFRQARP